MNVTAPTEFVTARVAKARLGIPANTLRRWADEGSIEYIRTPGDKRLYNVGQFIASRNGGRIPANTDRIRVAYCRVSSEGQRDDLGRQIEYMRNKFPEHTIISDVGSGLNWKRKGLRRILELAMRGSLSELVVAHRDRLSRFAFELLEWILSKHNVKLLVLDETMGSPDAELVQDVLGILHVYSCRVNGKRTYGKRKEDDQTNGSDSDAKARKKSKGST